MRLPYSASIRRLTQREFNRGYAAGKALGAKLVANSPTAQVIALTASEVIPRVQGHRSRQQFVEILKEKGVPANFHESIVKQAFGSSYISQGKVNDFNLFRLQNERFGNYQFKVKF